MVTHAPDHYICPICLGIQGVESDQTMLKQADLVYRNDLVSVFINSKWVGANEGHVKETYHCDGITLRQNNEPASEQHAFHYHLHVFPRYEGDNFNQQMVNGSRVSDPSERLPYAAKLRAYLKQQK